MKHKLLIAITAIAASLSAAFGLTGCFDFTLSDGSNDTNNSAGDNQTQITHTHTLTEHKAVAATCTAEGNTAYYTCDGCDLWFSDADGQKEISNHSAVTVVATGHSYKDSVTTVPTCEKNGVRTYICQNDPSHSYTEEIKATGHTYVKGKCTSGDSYLYSSGLEYTALDDGTYAVSGIGSTTDVNIVISPEYNAQPVTAIGASAFSGKAADSEDKTVCANIESVYIPDSVKEIGENAFAYCESLTDVNIPDSVKTIGDAAFSDCSALVEIAIPDSVESIGDKAFYNCQSLEKVAMPDNIDVGKDVFRGSINVEITYQHDLVFVEAKEATCTEAGNIAYYECTQCGNYYEDKDAQTRLYSVVVSPSHDFVEGVCTICGTVQNTVLITWIDEVGYIGKFALGTMENAIGLPENINVRTGDGLLHELPVTWDLSGYKKNEAGTYKIVGHIQLDTYHLNDGLTDEVEASIQIDDKLTGTADIVFVIDTTGSMSSCISNVKNNIISFAEELEGEGVSARWALVDYRDITCDGVNSTHIVMNGASGWYTSADEFKTAISNLTVDGGGDIPECAVDGLMKATELTTRKDARTFYVLVTDANYKVDNNYGIKTMDECIELLVENEVNVSAIIESGDTSYYQSLVEKTGGVLAIISNDFKAALFDKLVPLIENQVNN
jgi:hypothetical protein